MKTNLIIACWPGLRARPSLREREIPTVYVREQIDMLRHRIHGIAKVTFVLNPSKDAGRDTAVEQYLRREAPMLRCASEIIVRDSNDGVSYGAFSEGLQSGLRGDYDAFLLLEDDYVFAADHFDTVITNVLEQEGGQCGFMCAVAGQFNEQSWHAAVFIGMMRRKTVENIFATHGKLSYLPVRGNWAEATQSQVLCSRDVIDAGFTIADWQRFYSTQFWDGTRPVTFGVGPALVVPVQIGAG